MAGIRMGLCIEKGVARRGGRLKLSIHFGDVQPMSRSTLLPLGVFESKSLNHRPQVRWVEGFDNHIIHAHLQGLISRLRFGIRSESNDWNVGPRL